jgi:hypothetical protein
MEEDEYTTEYSITDIIGRLPDTLQAELQTFIRKFSLEPLDAVDDAIGSWGQVIQLMILSEYSILQFGVLLAVLQEQDLVLAADSKESLSNIAEVLRLLAGHIDLLIAPTTRH